MKKNAYQIHILPSFFSAEKRKKQRKSAGVQATTQNLLETASLDKLLTSFVRQYLRSSLSYGFFLRHSCIAGKKKNPYGWIAGKE
jgi:hypothetical protein